MAHYSVCIISSTTVVSRGPCTRAGPHDGVWISSGSTAVSRGPTLDHCTGCCAAISCPNQFTVWIEKTKGELEANDLHKATQQISVSQQMQEQNPGPPDVCSTLQPTLLHKEITVYHMVPSTTITCKDTSEANAVYAVWIITLILASTYINQLSTLNSQAHSKTAGNSEHHIQQREWWRCLY